MQKSIKPTAEFTFKYGDEIKEEVVLEEFYEKKFNELIGLTKSGQLKFHILDLPTPAACKNNTGFVLHNSLTNDLTKIIKQMKGGTYGPKE